MQQKSIFHSAGLKVTLAGLVLLALAGAAYQYLLPAYRDRQAQDQVAEVFVSTDLCRTDIARIVRETKAEALSTSLFGCDGGASAGVKISRHLRAIAINPAGAVTVTLDFRSLPELSPITNRLTLVPLVDASTPLGTADARRAIAGWRCGSAQDGTTVPARYLPANCRG